MTACTECLCGFRMQSYSALRHMVFVHYSSAHIAQRHIAQLAWPPTHAHTRYGYGPTRVACRRVVRPATVPHRAAPRRAAPRELERPLATVGASGRLSPFTALDSYFNFITAFWGPDSGPMSGRRVSALKVL